MTVRGYRPEEPERDSFTKKVRMFSCNQ